MPKHVGRGQECHVPVGCLPWRQAFGAGALRPTWAILIYREGPDAILELCS